MVWSRVDVVVRFHIGRTPARRVVHVQSPEIEKKIIRLANCVIQKLFDIVYSKKTEWIKFDYVRNA